MEPETSEHEIAAEPDGDGILVICTCGWQVWTRTTPRPETLQLAVAQIGGKHLANVNAPPAPPHEVLAAVGILALLVLLTAVAVYFIATS